jgi:hypothetical protein
VEAAKVDEARWKKKKSGGRSWKVPVGNAIGRTFH